MSNRSLFLLWDLFLVILVVMVVHLHLVSYCSNGSGDSLKALQVLNIQNPSDNITHQCEHIESASNWPYFWKFNRCSFQAEAAVRYKSLAGSFSCLVNIQSQPPLVLTKRQLDQPHPEHCLFTGPGQWNYLVYY